MNNKIDDCNFVSSERNKQYWILKVDNTETFPQHKYYKKLFIILLLITSASKVSFSQNLWDDQTIVDKIKSGIQYTYNFEFEKAEIICNSVVEKYPNNPAVLMFEALILYWKYYPLQTETEMGNQYESLLLKSLSESQLQLQKMPDHQLTNFFAMMPRMMLLEFYADNGVGVKSIPHLMNVYQSVINGFSFCKTTPEYYFTTGLYDYYIEAYPEANPFYKPFVYFFPGGNKERGLIELYECWQQSEFIGPEALTFLSYIYINFETDYAKGLSYALELTVKYPNNPLFAEYYIELLLLNRQYDEAEKVVCNFNESKKKSNFFNNTFLIFDAIIKEHFQMNYAKAEALYKETIPSLNHYGNYASRYISYAYFGLSRISKNLGLIEAAQTYRSQAEKLAQYPNVNFD